MRTKTLYDLNDAKYKNDPELYLYMFSTVVLPEKPVITSRITEVRVCQDIRNGYQTDDL